MQLPVRRFPRLSLLFALGAFVLAGAAAAADEAARLVSRANACWTALDDYQAALEIDLRLLGTDYTLSGHGRQKGDLLRIELAVPARFFQGADRTGETVTIVMAYDGRVFWQLVPMAGARFVRRIDYEQLARETGRKAVLPSLRLPALAYRLAAESGEENAADRHYLLTTQADQLLEAFLFPGTELSLALEPAAQAGVRLNRETLLPELINFYNSRGEIIRRMRFSETETNQGLTAGDFAFEPPEGAIVMDWTGQLLRQARQGAPAGGGE